MSRQDSTDDILSMKDLGSLPKGRAVVFPAGAPAALLRTVPVSKRSYAEKAAASEAAHNVPKGHRDSVDVEATTTTSRNRWEQLVRE